MRQVNESLFRAIALSFSAVLLVLFLLTNIDLAAGREEQKRLTKEIAELETENARILAETQARLSLSEIERYAREELGMQPLGPGQMVYLEPIE